MKFAQNCSTNIHISTISLDATADTHLQTHELCLWDDQQRRSNAKHYLRSLTIYTLQENLWSGGYMNRHHANPTANPPICDCITSAVLMDNQRWMESGMNVTAIMRVRTIMGIADQPICSLDTLVKSCSSLMCHVPSSILRGNKS